MPDAAPATAPYPAATALTQALRLLDAPVQDGSAQAAELAALLQQLPTGDVTLAAIARAVTGSARPRPLDDMQKDARGHSELDYARAAAESIANHAPQLMNLAERNSALEGLHYVGRAALMVYLAAPPDAEHAALFAKARRAVGYASPMTPEFFASLVTRLRGHDGDTALGFIDTVQQRTGEALLAALPPARVHDLPSLTSAQQMLSPATIKTRPSDTGRQLLHDLYTRTEHLPDYAAFGTALAAGLEQRLAGASDRGIAAYRDAVTGWGTMDRNARVAVLEQLLEDAAAVAGTPVPVLHVVDFGTLGRPTTNRGYQAADKTVPGLSHIWMDDRAGRSVLDSFPEAVSVLLHEFTHSHQLLLRACPSDAQVAALNPPDRAQFERVWQDTPANRAMAPLMRANGRHYIKASDDRAGYEAQPLEAEAHATQRVAVPRLMQLFSALAHRHDPAYTVKAAAKLLPVLDDIALIAEGPEAEALTSGVEALRRRLGTDRPATRDTARAALRDLGSLTDRAGTIIATLRTGCGTKDAAFADCFTEGFDKARTVVDALRLAGAERPMATAAATLRPQPRVTTA